MEKHGEMRLVVAGRSAGKSEAIRIAVEFEAQERAALPASHPSRHTPYSEYWRALDSDWLGYRRPRINRMSYESDTPAEQEQGHRLLCNLWLLSVRDTTLFGPTLLEIRHGWGLDALTYVRLEQERALELGLKRAGVKPS